MISSTRPNPPHHIAILQKCCTNLFEHIKRMFRHRHSKDRPIRKSFRHPASSSALSLAITVCLLRCELLPKPRQAQFDVRSTHAPRNQRHCDRHRCTQPSPLCKACHTPRVSVSISACFCFRFRKTRRPRSQSRFMVTALCRF